MPVAVTTWVSKHGFIPPVMGEAISRASVCPDTSKYQTMKMREVRVAMSEAGMWHSLSRGAVENMRRVT